MEMATAVMLVLLAAAEATCVDLEVAAAVAAAVDVVMRIREVAAQLKLSPTTATARVLACL